MPALEQLRARVPVPEARVRVLEQPEEVEEEGLEWALEQTLLLVTAYSFKMTICIKWRIFMNMNSVQIALLRPNSWTKSRQKS